MDRAGADDSLIEVDSIDNVNTSLRLGRWLSKLALWWLEPFALARASKAGWGIKAGSGHQGWLGHRAGSFKAGWGIKAGWASRLAGYRGWLGHQGWRIEAGWGIDAGRASRLAPSRRWGIKAGSGIKAGAGHQGWLGHRAGEGIKAGWGIEGLAQGWAIFAGLRVNPQLVYVCEGHCSDQT